MSRKLTRIAVLGVLLCGAVFASVRGGGGVSVAHAAATLPSASGPIYPSKRAVASDAGGGLRPTQAEFPSQASNPKACVSTATVEWTDL